MYFTDNNRLAFLRKHFDHAPTTIRFLYYIGAAIESYHYVEKVRRLDDVLADRTIFSTIAYHRAYGLPKFWTSFIPQFLLNQFDGVVFFHASNDERRKRLDGRNAANNVSTQSDDKSVALAARINQEYQNILPQGTIFINTDFKTPRQVMKEVKNQIQV